MGIPLYARNVATTAAASLVLFMPEMGTATTAYGKVNPPVSVMAPYKSLGSREVEALTALWFVQANEAKSTFLLMHEIARDLVTESHSLDADFSAVINEEFWNLF